MAYFLKIEILMRKLVFPNYPDDWNTVSQISSRSLSRHIFLSVKHNGQAALLGVVKTHHQI